MPCPICRRRRVRFGCPWCDQRQPSLFEPLNLPEPPNPVALEASRRAAEEAAEKEESRLHMLSALGRPVRVALVSCGQDKATQRSAARSLYISQLFKASLRYALQTCDDTYILSALHGLVELDTELDPYNFTMRELKGAEQNMWASQVLTRLFDRLPGLPLEIIGLAGRAYLDPLAAPLRERRIPLMLPLDRLRVGQRLSWLKHAMGQSAVAVTP